MQYCLFFALQGDASEGDVLDAGLFDEPFDRIRWDFARDSNLLRPDTHSYMRELKRF